MNRFYRIQTGTNLKRQTKPLVAGDSEQPRHSLRASLNQVRSEEDGLPPLPGGVSRRARSIVPPDPIQRFGPLEPNINKWTIDLEQLSAIQVVIIGTDDYSRSVLYVVLPGGKVEIGQVEEAIIADLENYWMAWHNKEATNGWQEVD